jgi:hypothetical protein
VIVAAIAGSWVRGKSREIGELGPVNGRSKQPKAGPLKDAEMKTRHQERPVWLVRFGVRQLPDALAMAACRRYLLSVIGMSHNSRQSYKCSTHNVIYAGDKHEVAGQKAV